MKFILKIFILFGCLSVAAHGATLREYAENIGHLKDDLSRLINPEEEWTVADKENFAAEMLEELPEVFPARQTVEWQGGSIETDNEWLVNKFTSYKDLPTGAPERNAILSEIYERLDAIEKKIAELEKNAAASPSLTRDEEKQKLAEILKRPEYAKPEEQQESWAAAALRTIQEWLRKLFPEQESAPRQMPQGFGTVPYVLQILIYAVLIGLIGFLIYKFAPFITNRIKTRERRAKRDRVILGERIAADQTSANLFGEAERMAQAGDLRGAIRKGYIALLCELSDRKLIGLSQHKTNRDYLRDVRQRRELYQNMNGLTDNFERHWYGFQEADEADWDEFKSGYQKAVKSN